MQYRSAQHYANHYPRQSTSSSWSGKRLGRLIVCRSPSDILMMDMLLPEYRRQETGAAVIRDLMAEAEQAGSDAPACGNIQPGLAPLRTFGFQQNGGERLILRWNGAPGKVEP
jgi:hypothetical protein